MGIKKTRCAIAPGFGVTSPIESHSVLDRALCSPTTTFTTRCCTSSSSLTTTFTTRCYTSSTGRKASSSSTTSTTLLHSLLQFTLTSFLLCSLLCQGCLFFFNHFFQLVGDSGQFRLCTTRTFRECENGFQVVDFLLLPLTTTAAEAHTAEALHTHTTHTHTTHTHTHTGTTLTPFPCTRRASRTRATRHGGRTLAGRCGRTRAAGGRRGSINKGGHEGQTNTR